jgi:DNA-directed RNA polymerase specialized sigma24 family protein
VGESEHGKKIRPGLAAWERKLIWTVARKFEVLEPEELEAELMRTVLEIKARPHPRLLHWKHYLAKALHNRADNWTRSRRAKARREIPIPEPDEEAVPFFAPSEGDPHLRMVLAQIRQELNPELRQCWELLDQENGNQARVARRLGKHRNTLRAWIGKIRRLLIKHGFQPDAPVDKEIVREPPPKRHESVVLPSRLFQALASVRLSGTQWRILLWVIRETSRRKQKTVPFSWYRIAKELSQDRGDVFRAGRNLLRAQLIRIQEVGIGLRKDFRQSGR